MNIIEAIKTRKSIRDFTADPVPQHILRESIEIASHAPSAENSQPWEFTVIAGDILDTIRKANIEKLNSNASPHPDLPTSRIRYFKEAGAPVDSYAVGSYISGATPIDFTGDIKEVDGRSIAKRGRIPGVTESPRLKRVDLATYRELAAT